jgi:putative hydrolase of the HAD superfamily
MRRPEARRRPLSEKYGPQGRPPGLATGGMSRARDSIEVVVNAVIFDFYGTLAHWADANADYGNVFAAHGYTLEATVADAYFTRYDGIEHGEHSVDEAAYEAWVRSRLRQLADATGVAEEDTEAIVDALRQLDQGPMLAYPEASATLQSLRQAGLAVGVCSNWGWELDAYIEEVGLLHLVDVRVTSARAGLRKPHPGIYATAATALGVDPADVLFVGDSWEPDVRGPRRMGMRAAHVWREAERVGRPAPALEPGDHRVGDLTGVLDIVGVPVS